MPKRRTCCGSDVEVLRVVHSTAPSQVQGAADRQQRRCGGEFAGADPRIGYNGQVPQRSRCFRCVASRVRRRRLLISREKVPAVTISSDAVVEAGRGVCAGGTGHLLLLVRVGRGA
jgi:hypothetical protein